MDTVGEGKHLEFYCFPGCVGGRMVVVNVSTHVSKTSEPASNSVGDGSYVKLVCYKNQFLYISSLVNFVTTKEMSCLYEIKIITELKTKNQRWLFGGGASLSANLTWHSTERVQMYCHYITHYLVQPLHHHSFSAPLYSYKILLSPSLQNCQGPPLHLSVST